MSLYAIGDTHLSLGVDKPMDIFGGGWAGYVEKLREGFSQIGPEDTVVLCGDLSWGMSLEQAREDFFAENGFSTLEILHNNCRLYGEVALCGTRGWFYEEERGEHSAKIFNRELLRLEASLKAAGEREKFCFLHYPPLYQGYRCQEILDLLERYQVSRCYYGHLHGGSHRLAFSGRLGTVEYHLVAADYIGFQPKKILD